MEKLIQRAAEFLDRSPGFFRQDVRLYELNRRFLWFIIFRFSVVFVFAVLSLAGNVLIPHVSISGKVFLALAGFLLATNLLYWFYYKSTVHRPSRIFLNVQVQIFLDFAVLGYLVYLCGGIESPLVYFFLFHNVISCLFFKKRVSLIHTLASLAIILLMSLGTHHHFIYPEAAAALYNSVTYSYHIAGITAVYMIVWFFAASITDSLKKREEKLQGKIDELIEMDQEKTRVMLVTTHELKAPFSSIQSYVNVVLGGYAGDVPAVVREILWKIKVRCETLLRMITEMIQLANISSLKERKEDVVMSRVNIVQLIGAVVKRFHALAENKGATFIWPEGATHEHLVNIEQFDILFNNVLSNSVNYCYPDSEIIIKIEDKEDRLLISVEDKGIGIKKEHLEKVFLEYFRTEKAALMNNNSTGLGLTIARQIMNIHGGRIWIDSEEGMGTTVFIEFPK